MPRIKIATGSAARPSAQSTEATLWYRKATEFNGALEKQLEDGKTVVQKHAALLGPLLAQEAHLDAELQAAEAELHAAQAAAEVSIPTGCCVMMSRWDAAERR